jgi:hypothetical protein
VCVGIRLEFAHHMDLKRTLINQYRLYWKFQILFDVSQVFMSRVPTPISASSSVAFILYLALHSFGKLRFYSSGPFFFVFVVTFVLQFLPHILKQ